MKRQRYTSCWNSGGERSLKPARRRELARWIYKRAQFVNRACRAGVLSNGPPCRNNKSAPPRHLSRKQPPVSSITWPETLSGGIDRSCDWQTNDELAALTRSLA